MSIRAMCINDSNQPIEIPVNKRVKIKKVYHITHLWWHPYQKVMAVSLQEINLDNENPYKTFKLDRFAIHVDDLDEFIKLAKECSGMNDADMIRLVEDLSKVNTTVEEEVN